MPVTASRPTLHSTHSRSPQAAPATFDNAILAALPRAERERLRPHLHPIDLPLGKVLHHEREDMDRVYFLESGMVSLVLTTQNGLTVEVGIIARESVVGLSNALTEIAPLTQALVQIAGAGYWMKAATLKTEFERGGALQGLLMCQLQSLLVQTAQTALCNRLHSVEQRLCRWLLLVRDRIGSDHIELTQEFLSHMLGVRRPGVSLAIGLIRDQGLIETNRGRVSLVDVPGLRRAACECHLTVEEYVREEGR